MSRVGKAPIFFEGSVQVTVSPDNQVVIKGGKSTQKVQLKPVIKAEVKDGQVILTRTNDEAQTRAYHGLYRALIQNAVTGVSKGWEKSLELNGVGYKAAVKGKTLELNLGYSHPIQFPIPDGIEITVEKQNAVKVAGASRELVGQVAANIRAFRPPEPYLGKGIKYSDEHIRRKAGKSAGK
ncbi:MAG: 50S ribosomal protein L6 [Pseudobdellovibrionaceae bacterium]|nr:50S ribosomal protein L6 [Bdellovibrionales bacterium]USN46263.1 MAG: 50S ribosomal protein L6 [Pseudobdellovibrionaceae bacterium]